MKQKLFFILFATSFALKSLANGVEINGIHYVLNHERKTASVTYTYYSYSSTWSSYSGDIAIPSSVPVLIDNNYIYYAVTSIGAHAFDCCKNLTSVSIPNSVTSIEYRAFAACTSLTSITIPNSVTSIDNGAFSGAGLTNITIPNSITNISNNTFDGCTNLTDIVISSSVTTIGECAFSGCSGLEKITIPESVTSIGNQAFIWSGLKSIIIPNSVRNLGNEAFRECTNLESATIGNSVVSTGETTFKNCSNLKDVYLGSSVQEIGGCAFLNCSNLKKVVTPNSLKTISGGAFWDCTSLSSITIPENVETLGSLAFCGCYNLRDVVSEIENPFDIDKYVFEGIIYSQGKLTVPGNSIEKYREREGWKNFVNIEGKNYDCLANGVFYNLSGSQAIVTYRDKTGADYSGDVVIPETIEHNGKTYDVTCIGDSAFYNCTGLNSISLPNSVARIGRNAFNNTGWFDNQPDGVVYAGKVAYAYKGTMPKGTELVLKEGTLGIASYAFSGCQNMVSFTIPNSVRCLGNHSFISCTGLTSAFIPKNVTSIGIAPFDRCEGLESIVVEEGNPKYDSRNNCNAIIEKETGTLLSGCKNTIIPNDITSIGEAAFSQCNGLTTITIPNNITAINSFAFVSCANLSSIVLPPNLKAIERQTFQLCTSLESIDIPDNVENIGLRAFLDCKKLAKIKIGTGLRGCGEYAFSNCESIASITIDNNYLVSMDYTVDSKLCDMFGSMYFAMAKEYTIGEHVTSIGERAFQTCNVMETLTLPSSLTEIKRWAFNGCSKLRSVIAKMDNPFDLSETYPVFSSLTYSGGTLYVPAGTKELYQSKSGWRKFANIVETGTTEVKGVTGNNADTSIKEVYTLDGHKLTAPQRGLNILRMSDGTVHKVVIK